MYSPHYGAPPQQYGSPSNIRPKQPSYMLPKGRFANAPPGIMRGGGTLQRGNTSVLGYGQNNDAFTQANAIYAGLPGGGGVYGGTPTSPPGVSGVNPLYAPVAVPPSAAAAYAPQDIYKTIDVEAGIASWYLVGRPRPQVKKIAVEILKQGRVGEFFVRDITSHPGCLGLSVKTSQNDLMNYLLQPTPGGTGLSIRGTKEVFPTMTKLINHYKNRKRPSLPVQLIDSSIRGIWDKHPVEGATGERRGKKDKRRKAKAKAAQQKGSDGGDIGPESSRGPSSHKMRSKYADDEEESFDGFGNDDEVGATSEHLQPYNKDSAVAKAITDKVNEAVTHLANDYVSNIERKLAKRRALVQRRKLELMEKNRRRQEESLDTFAREDGARMFDPDASMGSTRSGQSTPGEYLPRRQYDSQSEVSLADLERARGGSQGRGGGVSPESPDYGFTSRHQPSSAHAHANTPDLGPLRRSASIVQDPSGMWDAIMASSAPADKKLNAAKKQLEYLRNQEMLIQEQLRAEEARLQNPRTFDDNDTVFDDMFENGTIIDESGEVYGFV